MTKIEIVEHNPPLTEEEEKQKKFSSALRNIQSLSLKNKVLQLDKIKTEVDNIETKQFAKEDTEIEKKKEANFILYFNKIREVIGTKDAAKVNVNVKDTDYETYGIVKNQEHMNMVDAKPMEHFWKRTLKNAVFFDMSKSDEKILEYLTDITYKPVEGRFPSFTIELHFDKNEYFDHEIISKTYYYNNEDRKDYDTSFATEIKWSDDDLDPTKRIVTKVNKKKKGKAKKTTIVKKRKSFFNIFTKGDDTAEKDIVEADFWYKDFLPNSFEYYMNIIEINYVEDDDGELQEEKED